MTTLGEKAKEEKPVDLNATSFAKIARFGCPEGIAASDTEQKLLAGQTGSSEGCTMLGGTEVSREMVSFDGHLQMMVDTANKMPY